MRPDRPGTVGITYTVLAHLLKDRLYSRLVLELLAPPDFTFRGINRKRAVAVKAELHRLLLPMLTDFGASLRMLAGEAYLRIIGATELLTDVVPYLKHVLVEHRNHSAIRG